VAVKVLPFRLGSSRFPGKPLAMFDGSTLIENALRIASTPRGYPVVITAPRKDFEIVSRRVELSRFSFRYIPSGEDCGSATERILEIYELLGDEPVVSIPVDEAALDGSEVDRIIEAAQASVFDAITCWCEFFEEADARSGLSAKLVLDRKDEVLYMSRAAIPASKEGAGSWKAMKKHVGVFVFSRSFLDRLKDCRNLGTELDRREGLEQLRWLELGFRIKALRIDHIGFGIDLPDQVAALEERVRCARRASKPE
jgi:3-deoxy-manno-octulosonate cytidylyltransferase (CMP-KDO synthetase)